MAGIKLEKVGTSALVGVADVLTEEVDLYKGYNKAFQRITDWGRVIYAGGGYVANVMGYLPEEVTEAAVLSGVPLLEKSVWKLIKEYTGIGVAGKGRMGLKLIKKGRKIYPPSEGPGVPGTPPGSVRWG